MAKLTEKRQQFVDEYLIDLNGTQAAIRAGYSPKTANEQAARLLANVSIQEAVSRAMAERSKRTGVNQDRVVQELARLAFVDPSKLINTENASIKEDASGDDLACIQSVKVKTSDGERGTTIEREIKLNDKIRALEMLGRHLGMFKDKVELEGDIGVTIVDDV